MEAAAELIVSKETKLEPCSSRTVMTPAEIGLVHKINSEHKACREALNATAEHARRCGQLLLEAKAKVGHGNWTAWKKRHLKFGDSTAAAYMRIYLRWQELPNLQPGANLTVKRAIALLATPKAPPEEDGQAGPPEQENSSLPPPVSLHPEQERREEVQQAGFFPAAPPLESSGGLPGEVAETRELRELQYEEVAAAWTDLVGELMAVIRRYRRKHPLIPGEEICTILGNVADLVEREEPPDY